MTADAEGGRILDLVQIEEIRALPGRNGGSLLHEFVALFLREEPGRMALLPGLARRGEREELFRLAHTLAGSCAMLGAVQMQRAALKVQAAAKAAPLPEIEERLAELDASWSRLQEAMARHGMVQG